MAWTTTRRLSCAATYGGQRWSRSSPSCRRPTWLEACGGSHHWGGRLGGLGHTVQLIPPHYVKPFVRRGKNDRNDAEAISEAASRPGMPSVPVKAPEQQAEAIVLSARELLVRQRTQLVNAVRGHAAEFGIVAAKGTSQLPALLEAVAAEAAVPDAAKEMLAFLGAQVAQLDERIAELEQRMKRQHKANAMSRALAEVPGIGPIEALRVRLESAFQRASLRSSRIAEAA